MKTVILGLDAFDPNLFEQLSDEGKLPYLSRYRDDGKYSRFTVSSPPQSEVSWTSIATGLNPGGHGMFDFVHRDPSNYGLIVSLLPTQKSIVGTQFARPYNAKTIFDQAVSDGYPATSLWWPATFPAKPQSPVHSIPGLGTPDILGQLGVGTLFTLPNEKPTKVEKTRHVVLERKRKGEYSADFPGPLRKRKGEMQPATVPLSVTIDGSEAKITVGKERVTVAVGQWSPIVTLTFKMGWLFSVRAITRLIVSTEPTVQIYALPLQIDLTKTLWHTATPPRWAKQLWREHGPFLTLGWPQDTTGLEEGCITDEQFLALCTDIVKAREAVLMGEIGRFREGIIGCIFDTLDRIQHMFWRDRPDIVAAWYEKLDGLVGRVQQRLQADQLLIVSDHGFSDFHTKAHLNRWLRDNGYLTIHGDNETFRNIDWSQTTAYAIGLNSLYLNLQGREGQGIVSPDERATLLNEISAKMTRWQDESGGSVVRQLLAREEAFDGALVEYAPDLVVGYAPGYRASSQTGLGEWGNHALEANHDHWGADHCIDASAVSGVIFAQRDLVNFPNPSYRDIPALAIGKNPDGSNVKPPPTSADDDALIEERLKGLGYL